MSIRSGLVGLADTPDMRELLATDAPDSRLALEVYTHSPRAGIATMAAALAGLDAIVFTSGVAENSPTVRSLAAAYVVTAREDLEIAREVRAVLADTHWA